MTSFFNTPLSGDVNVPADASAMLVMIHGMAEHRARYDGIASLFAARGIATCRFDQRGHGASVPANSMRGDAAFEDFVADAAKVLDGVRAAYPTLPVFVWGHSMGAVIAVVTAASYTEQRPRAIKGMITSSPPIAAFDNVPRIALTTLKALSRIVPKYGVALPFKPEFLSTDPQVGIHYAADPLIPKKVSLRLLVGLAAASAAATRTALKLAVPWLAMHGDNDQVAPPIGSQRLFDRLRSRDKEFVVWPAARHEVHNEKEPTRSQFLEKIITWIHAHSAD